MAREDYSVIMVKKETKEMMDKIKTKTGKSLWFIMNEAIEVYYNKIFKK